MFKLDIKKSDLVLEVGSGDFPNIYSDVLVDKFPSTNQCRNFDLKTNDRPFIVADGEKLPFRDNAFDYSISANAMTYSENPDKFIDELTRVAPRGLLILPTELNEIMYDTPLHRWFINYQDGKLIFRPKKIARSFGRFFHLLYRRNKKFRKFQDDNSHLFYIVLRWEGKVDYVIEREVEEPVVNLRNEEEILKSFKLDSSQQSLLGAVKALFPNKLKYHILKKQIQLSRYPRPKINIEELMACPECKGDLTDKERTFFCPRCQKPYTVLDGIPYLCNQRPEES